MTTGISLVRENAENLQPPRTLWVTFPLGRPMGVPNDRAFQHRVMNAGLALLQRESGPVLEDYPEDISDAGEFMPPACPVSFASSPEEGKEEASQQKTWQHPLSVELDEMKPWYDMGLKRRNGRTLVGVCPSPIQDIMARLGGYLDQNELPTNDLVWFKHAIEDAKAYYIEAMTAQPGHYAQDEVYANLWHETALGRGLKQFHTQFSAHPKLSGFGRIVLPRSALSQDE